MNQHEEEILRLNKKIRQLIARNEQTMTKNVYLETESKKMCMEHDELKELCSKTSALNVTYKIQLDKEIACKEDTMEGNQIMKKKLNNVTAKCLEQKEKIKTLEYSLQRSAVKRVSQVPIQIVGSISEIIKQETQLSKDYAELQEKNHQLLNELNDANAVIDELEFELDDIDYLEMEIQRLQKENNGFKEMLKDRTQNTRGNNVPDSLIANKSQQQLPQTGVNYAAKQLNNVTLKVNQQEEAAAAAAAVNNQVYCKRGLKNIKTRKAILLERLESFRTLVPKCIDK